MLYCARTIFFEFLLRFYIKAKINSHLSFLLFHWVSSQLWKTSFCHQNNLVKSEKCERKMYVLDTMYLVSWESEATSSATPFFKRAYRISHPPQLQVSWDDLPSFASLSQSAKNGLSKSIFYVKNHPNLSEFFFQWRIIG